MSRVILWERPVYDLLVQRLKSDNKPSLPAKGRPAWRQAGAGIGCHAINLYRL